MSPASIQARALLANMPRDRPILAEAMRRAVEELERLHQLEVKASVWASYQCDDSQRDQATDVHLRVQADNAARELFEAVL